MAGNRLCVERGKKMSTTIRPELSPKNHYWIERHRYYELKHFCLQYPIWKKHLTILDGYSQGGLLSDRLCNAGLFCDTTCQTVEARIQYTRWKELVEHVATETASDLAPYILKAVTEGLSYDILKMQKPVPCCRDTYYELYRRFFWLLSKERQ